MKAVQIKEFGTPKVLKINDIVEPCPDKNEVKISMKACGINHLDIWVRKGILDIALPHILGSDGTGEIVDLGEKVNEWKIGDKVVIHPGIFCGSCKYCLNKQENFCDNYKILGESCSGLQSEFFCIDKKNIQIMPKHLSFSEVASMPLVFMTAWQMLVERASIQKNEWVLIYGASSGVGSAAIQIAKHFGANVIATIGNDSKIKHAKAMGADYIINHYDQKWEKIAENISDGGMDIIFEHIGLETWDSSMKLLKKNGRVVTCGATTGYKVKIDLRHLFFKQLSILGSTMSNFKTFELVIKKINNKIFTPFIDSVFPYENVVDAHQRIENRQHTGKVVLKFN